MPRFPTLTPPHPSFLVISNGTAERHDSVTVSFVKLKNFDRLIDVLRPEEYVALLDAIFRTFDAIATRHGIEKIKTIGVRGLSGAGLPPPLSLKGAYMGRGGGGGGVVVSWVTR